MKKIILPIDVKSLYFNIKNDNKCGHTPTVASPLRKTNGLSKLEDVLLLIENEIDISNKNDLIDLLVKHSKSKVLIRHVYEFKNISVNGKPVDVNYSFGLFVKEEVDETKYQFGRLKLHYPAKFIYEDDEININNREVYRAISRRLGNYAFVVTAFEYDLDSKTINFDALIVGENEIPYSKVFVNEKGAGNKFNRIFNENADDYDREIISLRRKFGDDVNTFNYLEYLQKIKKEALGLIKKKINKELQVIYEQYPYSLFDFVFENDGVKQYGILRVTATKDHYFNISLIQQLFMMNNPIESNIYLVSNVLDKPDISIYSYEDLTKMSKSINSLKYEGE